MSRWLLLMVTNFFLCLFTICFLTLTRAEFTYAEELPPELTAPILATETKKEVQLIQTEHGRILPYSETPELYQTTLKVFRRVAAQQEAFLQNNYVPINYLFILDTPEANAFVYAPKKIGVRVSINLVFVTTAMLRKLINIDNKFASSEAEFVSGVHRLAAVFAHELAHPLDALITRDNGDNEILSIEKEYGDRASQAIELRSDLSGADLLRAANLPEGSMLLAQERTLNLDTATNSLVAGLDTHPENSMRLTIMRMHLTLNRMRLGDNQSEKPFLASEFNVNGTYSDLAKVAIGAGPYPWKQPKNISETLWRLKSIANVPELFQELEYNRLFLSLNKQIRQQEQETDKQKLSPEIENEIIETIHFLFKKNITQDLWDKQTLGTILSEQLDSRELLSLPTHSESLKALKFYHDTKYVRMISRALKDKEMKFIEAMNYLPPEIVIKKYADELILEHYYKLQSGGYLQKSFTRVKKRELVMAVVDRLQHKFAIDADREHIVGLLLISASQNLYAPFFLKSQNSYSSLFYLNKNFKSLARQTRMLAKKNNQHSDKEEALKNWEALKKYTQWFWANRGFFAIQEIIMNIDDRNAIIDWDFVAEILDLDQNQIGNQIAKEVRKNLATFPSELGHYALHSDMRGIKTQNTTTTAQPHQLNQGNSMPFWYKSSIGTDILNQRRNAPAEHAELTRGTQILSRSIITRDAIQRAKTYRQHLAQYFLSHSTPKWTIKNVAERLAEIETSFTDFWWYKVESYPPGIEHISFTDLAKAVDTDSTLSVNEKKIILRFVLLRDAHFNEKSAELVNRQFYNWTSAPAADLNLILDVLIRHGVVKNSIDLVQQIKLSPYYSPIVDARNSLRQNENPIFALESYYELVDHLAIRLAQDLLTVSPMTFEALKVQTEILNTRFRLNVRRTASNTPNIQDLRNVFAKMASELSPTLTLQQRMTYFLLLTGSGSSSGSDEFFEQHLKNDVLKTSTGLAWLKGVLIKNRIESNDFRLRLAQLLLAPRIAAIKEKNQLLKEDLYSLVNDLNLMAPTGSLSKDKFIESLAWELQLKDANLFAFIEDQKTSNWKSANPNTVNAGSVLTNGIFKLSASRRKIFLRYLMDPRSNKEGLPSEIVRELEQQALDQLAPRGSNTHSADYERFNKIAKDAAKNFKLEIEKFLRDSAPTERIPLIEITLTSGATSLIKQSNFPFNITRDFLEYTPDSLEEKMLLSYLAIIKPHEVAPSIAYLLSQASGDNSTLSSLFEIFGTVGIKFGQLSSIWKVFGPNAAAETRHLKNNASAMTRYEIYERMKEFLPTELINKIELEKILGSASVKTVVRIRLDDGRRAAMALQARPVANQIATNLNLGRRFLNELERHNMVKKSSMISTLVDALRSQLDEEIDFKLEATRFAQARTILLKYNRTNRLTLRDWSFDVPSTTQGLPLNKELAFYDLATGVFFDELTDIQKAEVGPIILRASLAMFFRYGWFDPDRHKGNWLIDSKTKTIYALDFGQLEKFEARNIFLNDSRLILIEFLNAIKNNDITNIYFFAQSMMKAGTIAPLLTNELKTEMQTALALPSFSEKIIDLFTALTEAGFEFNRQYSFGVLKGMVVLFGEQYVNDDLTLKIMNEEIKSLLLKKLPALAIGRIKQKIKHKISCRDILAL